MPYEHVHHHSVEQLVICEADYHYWLHREDSIYRDPVPLAQRLESLRVACERLIPE